MTKTMTYLAAAQDRQDREADLVIYRSPDWTPENALPDFPDLAFDYPVLLAQAETALGRRLSSYPEMVAKGTLNKEEADKDVRGWTLLVAEWRWIVHGTGKRPRLETLPDRIAAVDLALERIEKAIQRGNRSKDVLHQLACNRAMRWHLDRRAYGDVAVHFYADLTRKIREDIKGRGGAA